MLMNRTRRLAAERGFVMLEVLITFVIISIGLLGLAGLQSRLTLVEMESYQREQALILLNDMVAKMTNNPKGGPTYAFSGSSPSTVYIGAGTAPACPAISGSSLSQASATATCDVKDWENVILGSTEGALYAALTDARACIETTPTVDEYRVTITWQGTAPTAEPPVSCASSAYADPKLRRALTALVRSPDLDCDSVTLAGC